MPKERRTLAEFPKRKINSARTLRQEQTPAERKLWLALRDHRLADFKFRRQHAIGPYITDFACPAAMLVVELDGSQHSPQIDAERSRFLTTRGYRVIRFDNVDVLKRIEDVTEAILKAVSLHGTPTRRRSAPPPSPSKEGEE